MAAWGNRKRVWSLQKSPSCVHNAHNLQWKGLSKKKESDERHLNTLTWSLLLPPSSFPLLYLLTLTTLSHLSFAHLIFSAQPTRDAFPPPSLPTVPPTDRRRISIDQERAIRFVKRKIRNSRARELCYSTFPCHFSKKRKTDTKKGFIIAKWQQAQEKQQKEPTEEKKKARSAA